MYKSLVLLAPCTFLAALFAAAPARAGIEACGDIEIDASAKCEVKVGGGCTAMCEPLSFTASCYASCDGECNVSADVECTASCEGSCGGECDVDPGSYDCKAGCEAECDGSCDSHCSSSSDKTSCKASCEATCSGECGASCEGTPPSATCEAKCEASCEGSCKAEVNVNCQVSCQAGCTADLQGGCELECQKPEGALFCDGQFIDHGGNLDECVNALRDLLDIEVTMSGSASCEDGVCKAEGAIGCSCTTGPGAPGPAAGWLATLAGLAAGVGMATRRRRGSR
jgi:MYXO-CTERM domain-containing protein